MTPSPAQALQAGLALTEWNLHDLWVASYALGSCLTVASLGRAIRGEQALSPVDYRMLRLALNEHLGDLGLDHPVMSWDKTLTAEP